MPSLLTEFFIVVDQLMDTYPLSNAAVLGAPTVLEAPLHKERGGSKEDLCT